jgi:hypothetical protein
MADVSTMGKQEPTPVIGNLGVRTTDPQPGRDRAVSRKQSSQNFAWERSFATVVLGSLHRNGLLRLPDQLRTKMPLSSDG